MEEKNQQQFNKNEEKNRNEVIPENNITTSKKDKEKNNTYKNEIKMKNIQNYVKYISYNLHKISKEQQIYLIYCT